MKTHRRSAPMEVFRGYRSDYGAGLGNIFTGLLRAAVPIIAPAVKNIGKTLVTAGSNRLSHIIKNKLDPGNMTAVATPPPTRTSRPRKRKRTPISKRPRKKKPFARGRRTKADIFSS